MIYENIKNRYKYEIVDESDEKISLRRLKTQEEISMLKITFQHYFRPAISRYTCHACGYSLKGEQSLKLICEACNTQLNEKTI